MDCFDERMAKIMKININKLDIILARQCKSMRSLLNISPQTLTRIKQGKEIKPATAGRLAASLKVDVTEIIEQEV